MQRAAIEALLAVSILVLGSSVVEAAGSVAENPDAMRPVGLQRIMLRGEYTVLGRYDASTQLLVIVTPAGVSDCYVKRDRILAAVALTVEEAQAELVAQQKRLDECAKAGQNASRQNAVLNAQAAQAQAAQQVGAPLPTVAAVPAPVPAVDFAAEMQRARLADNINFLQRQIADAAMQEQMHREYLARTPAFIQQDGSGRVTAVPRSPYGYQINGLGEITAIMPPIPSPRPSPPFQAENGDYQGMDNDGDGRLEPNYVRGYSRNDGTYVRSHYRAQPSALPSRRR